MNATTTAARGHIGVVSAAVVILAIGLTASSTPAGPPEGLVADDHLPIYFPLPPRRSARQDQDRELPEDVLQLFMTYHTTMQYPQAAECALRLTRIVPDRPIGYYNLACALSRLHRADEALVALEQAIDRGWRNAEHTSLDPDLRLIRSTDRYAALVLRMTELSEEERIAPMPLRTDGWVAVAQDLVEQVPSVLERHGVPGMTIALVHDGRVTWTSAFGIADLETGAPMQVDQRFRLRSPVHLLALAAALRFEQEGFLSLESIVAEHDELVQVAGIEDGEHPAVRLATLEPGTGRPATADASDWSFHQLLVAAIEAGVGFQQVCRDDIFGPLGMGDTDLVHRRTDLSKMAVGHSLFGTPVDRDSVARRARDTCYTTSGDLARLLAALLPRIESVDAAGRFGPHPVARLFELSELTPAGLPSRVAVDQGTDGPRIEFSERLGGAGCLARGYAGNGTALVVMFNSENGLAAARELAGAALGGW